MFYVWFWEALRTDRSERVGMDLRFSSRGRGRSFSSRGFGGSLGSGFRSRGFVGDRTTILFGLGTDGTGDGGTGSVKHTEQGGEEVLAAADIGQGFHLLRSQELTIEDGALDARTFGFGAEFFDHLSGAADVGFSEDDSGLTFEVSVQSLRKTAAGTSHFDVAVFGDVEAGSNAAQAFPDLVELRHGHAGIVHEEDVGGGVDPRNKLISDDFFVGIHLRRVSVKVQIRGGSELDVLGTVNGHGG